MTENLTTWKATEETGNKNIAGVEVTYLKNPPAKKITGIVRQHNTDPDTMNFEIVRFIVKSPGITRELWDEMGSAPQSGLISLAMELCGFSKSFLG